MGVMGDRQVNESRKSRLPNLLKFFDNIVDKENQHV